MMFSRSNRSREGSGFIIGAALVVCFFLSALAAYATHIVTTIVTGQILLLIVGLIVFPIGVIHGWLVWFGFA